MKINLSTIPVMWTTCEKDSLIERNKKVYTMLSDLGFSPERINGPITTPYPIGVAQGYLNMLKKHPAPFFSFEDDAKLCTSIPPDFLINIPDNADAVYFGTSIFGRIRGQSIPNAVISANHDAEYLRIFNMLSLHSILYVNQNYVNACIDYLTTWLKNPVGGCDEPIAEKMHVHNIYCVRKPWFFQNDGHSDQATSTPITPIL